MKTMNIKDKLAKPVRNIIKNGAGIKTVENILRHSRHSIYKISKNSEKNHLSNSKYFIFVFVAIAACFGVYTNIHLNETSLRNALSVYSCIIPQFNFVSEIARPALNCSFCSGRTSVDVVHSIDSQRFLEHYAYTYVPLLVKGAARNWTAVNTYSYDYFKNLYTNAPGSLENVMKNCQFFSYKTEFIYLEEIFKMSERRVRNEPGERTWYIGWCDVQSETEKQLKKHYRTPNFLPAGEQELHPDWVFMGWPGDGAYIHIDIVRRPSWQAQVRGSKTWNLYPSPECDHVCHPLSITLETGDILTVNTNVWFHSTHINEGSMSISIGSEY